jgi:hypothetical protein
MVRFFFLSALFILLPMLLTGAPSSADLLLNGNDIDLLVGAPTGIAEPLDPRRTRIKEEKQYDYSTLLDEDFLSDARFEDLGWADAEEQPADEDMTESQYLDLMSETDELEGSDFEEGTKTEANSTVSVETEFKL